VEFAFYAQVVDSEAFTFDTSVFGGLELTIATTVTQ
jgi:hypothetical protein